MRIVNLATLCALLIGGCATQLQHTVPKSDVDALSAEAKASYAEEEKVASDLDFELSDRRIAFRAADRETKVADLMVQRATAHEGIQDLRQQSAQDTKDADKLLPAKQNLEAAKVLKRRATAYRRASNATRDYHAARVEEVTAALAVADAELERAKYNAVAEAKETPEVESSVILADFDKTIAARKVEHAETKKKVAKAKGAMQSAQKKLAKAGGKPLDVPGVQELTTADEDGSDGDSATEDAAAPAADSAPPSES